MHLKLLSTCVFLIFLLQSVTAEDPSEEFYQDYGIEFEIPVGWNVADVQQIQDDNTSMNDTKIVLTDSKSAIRIDIIEIPQVSWLMQMYDNVPHCVVGILQSYYSTYILKSEDEIFGGTGLPVYPDGTKSMAFATQKSGDMVQWVVTWTKPGYGDKFIAIRGYFQGNYKMEDVSTSWQGYKMEEPLNDILTSFDVEEDEGNVADEAKIDLISII